LIRKRKLFALEPPGYGEEIFTFPDVHSGLVEIRDFQTTGVVAFARGCPFYALRPGRLDVMGQRVKVNQDYKKLCVDAMNELVAKL
jgi:hypothetical protein